MHIRLTTIDGPPIDVPPDLLRAAVIERCPANPGRALGVSDLPERTSIRCGREAFAVRETPDEILALLAAAASAPSRPDSIEEERLAAGWRQERLRNGPHDDEHPTWTAGDPGGLRRWRVADGWLGEWHLHVSGCWVRWLVPVGAP